MKISASFKIWCCLLFLGAVLSFWGLSLASPPRAKHKLNYANGSGSFQWAFTKANLKKLFHDWKKKPKSGSKNGLTLNRELLYPGDTLLPLGYGFFYTALLALLFLGVTGFSSGRTFWLCFFPAVAMILDLGENYFMDNMLIAAIKGQLEQSSAWIPFVIGIFSVLKYALISILTPFLGYRTLWFLRSQQGTSTPILLRYLAAFTLWIPALFILLAIADKGKFHGYW